MAGCKSRISSTKVMNHAPAVRGPISRPGCILPSLFRYEQIPFLPRQIQKRRRCGAARICGSQRLPSTRQFRMERDMTTEDNSQDVQDEINKLLANPLANEDLLIRLGELDGALFVSPTDKEKRGLRFLRNLVERVQTTICTNEFARANGQDASTQRKALAVAATIDFLGA